MPPHEIGYPDFDQGFGRVDLSAILSYEDTPKRKLLFVDVLNNSSEALESRAPIGGPRKAMQTYTVTVPLGATEPLSIVLTWTDWPAVYVQNNLDLNVRGPANLRVSGNSEHTWSRQLVLDDDPYDRFNNVEGVSIANPAPGTYRIQVIAENTVQSPQGYALCVCGEVTSILERL